jgi:alpha-L-rhamnosidase
MSRKTSAAAAALLASAAISASLIAGMPATAQKQATPAARDSSLEQAFINPPPSARPHTWWHWMNGNITKAGITSDLEAMKRVGIGGAQIFNVDVGFPDGDMPMMSAKWSDAIQYALKEGKRLGLEICLHNGAGWSSSGGPWITPAQGMQFLTWSETPVQGPAQFNAKLPDPPSRENYYRDVAVYLVRRASGAEPRIANIRAKAAFKRADHLAPTDTSSADTSALKQEDIVKLPVGSLRADGTLTADIPAGSWTILRMGHTPTGETNHPAPATGRGLECDKLSRAALDTHWAGMMGPIVNRAGKRDGITGLNNCLIDSYEVGSQNWSPEFKAEFIKRRGYDPMPYLPAITGRVVTSTEITERFLWDLRRTICDLFADNYFGYLARICHQNGLKFSTEPYGNGEFDNLEIGGTADIPMGEFWVGGAAIETTKLASSAGHVYGKPVIGAESFTADTPNARWAFDPYSIKALGDRVFSLGVNRYIFHRYAHQPWPDLKPGMTMGPWGTNFDSTNTWWEQGAAWLKYVARCQYLLQSGKFAADFLYFTGDDGPNDLPMLKGTLIPDGYDYDGIDARALQQLTVVNGKVTTPSGMMYSVLILPDSAWMTPATARKIKALCAAGATIFGAPPRKSPSLQGYPACDTAVEAIGKELWAGLDGSSKTSRSYGRGRVIWQKVPNLATIVTTPDCKMVTGREKSMVWIHRHLATGEAYFVANQKVQPQSLTVDFRVSGLTPEIWEPATGKIYPAPVWSANPAAGTTSVTLPLSAAESVFVMFRKATPPTHLTSFTARAAHESVAHAPTIQITSARYEATDGAGGVDVTDKVRDMVQRGSTAIEATNANFGDPTSLHVKQLHVVFTLDGKPQDKTVGENSELALVPETGDTARPVAEIVSSSAGVVVHALQAGSVAYKTSSGRETSIALPEPIISHATGSWKLSFPPHLGAPDHITFSTLFSWPESDVEGIKYFSGSATYETTLMAPYAAVTDGRVPYLDLGTVKNIAEVWLNGKSLGILWKPPFRVNVQGVLKAGANQLKIRVTNLWPNRLIGDEHYPQAVEWNGDAIKAWPDWLLAGKKRPESPRVAWTTWRVFTKDSPLYPSGLIGPVEIVSAAAVPLTK